MERLGCNGRKGCPPEDGRYEKWLSPCRDPGTSRSKYVFRLSACCCTSRCCRISDTEGVRKLLLGGYHSPGIDLRGRCHVELRGQE